MNEKTFWENQATQPTKPPAEALPPTALALKVPREVAQLAVKNQLVAEAQDFVVEDDPSFQMADEIQSSLRRSAKQIDDKRMEFTRPIDALKKQWMEFFKPAVDSHNQAAAIYQSKMAQYRAEVRRKAEEAQRKAEQLLREQREAEERKARELEEKALRLKSAKAKAKAEQEAQDVRAAAAMIPESVALAASEPTATASNVAELWRWEIDGTTGGLPALLGWLQTHLEWLGVIKLQDGEMNRLAKQCQKVVRVPGLRFFTKDSFRSKPR